MLEQFPELSGLGASIAKFSDSETNDAYQGFLTFAYLTGKARSLEAVAEKLGYNVHTVKIWCTQYNWIARVDQVDAQRWLREFRERERLTAKDNKKFAERNTKIREKSFAVSEKMLAVAEKLLQSADLAGEIIETGHVETADGRKVATMTEIHMKAKISDIPRLVDTAVKVARLAGDLPTEIVDRMIPATGDLSTLSFEELTKMRDDNREILIEKGAIQKLESLNN